MSGLTNLYHIWRSSLPNEVLNSISVLGELYPFWEPWKHCSKKAMRVIPTASRLLIGGLLLQTEKEGPSGVWRSKTCQEGGWCPGGPLQCPHFIAYVTEEAKSEPLPPRTVTTSQHQEVWAPGEQWLGDLPAMNSDRKPSAHVRISWKWAWAVWHYSTCALSAKTSTIGTKHSTLQVQGWCESVTDFCSAQRPLTFLFCKSSSAQSLSWFRMIQFGSKWFVLDKCLGGEGVRW